MLRIEITDEQHTLPIDARRLEEAVRSVLEEAGVREATVSVAVVDDATIHRLNARYLGHDSATDVLSFLLERDGARLDGEVVVSAETANRVAAEVSWPAHDELLLYVVHGSLHLVGHDDQSAADRQQMRVAERRHLERLGLKPPRGESGEETQG